MRFLIAFLLYHKGKYQQNDKHYDIYRCKALYIFSLLGEGEGGVELIGDEARHRGDESAETSYVDAVEKSSVIVGKSRKQHGGRYIAYYLADHSSRHYLSACYDRGEEVFYRLDTAHVSYEHKEKHKGDKQAVIDLFENISVEYQQAEYHGAQHEGQGSYPHYIQKTEGKKGGIEPKAEVFKCKTALLRKVCRAY